MKLKIITTTILISLGFYACEDNAPKDNNSVLVSEENNNNEPAPEVKDSSEGNLPKVEMTEDAQTAIAIIDKVVGLGKGAIKKMKIKDSISMANREKMYAYQIGLPVRHEDDIIDEYNKLTNAEDVYVFKKGRREYLMIKFEGKTEKELNDSLESYKNQLPVEIVGSAKIINLMSICSRKETLVIGEKIKKNKKSNEVPCLICD
jgi:hypothetical protein